MNDGSSIQPLCAQPAYAAGVMAYRNGIHDMYSRLTGNPFGSAIHERRTSGGVGSMRHPPTTGVCVVSRVARARSVGLKYCVREHPKTFLRNVNPAVPRLVRRLGKRFGRPQHGWLRLEKTAGVRIQACWQLKGASVRVAQARPTLTDIRGSAGRSGVRVRMSAAGIDNATSAHSSFSTEVILPQTATAARQLLLLGTSLCTL